MLSQYKAIFQSALKLTDEVARVRYLDEACGNNLDLRGQVESLLQAHDDAQEFMQPTEAQAEPLVGPAINDFVGEYRLREKIGEGGMGVVYVAEQVEPVHRKVALKIIKPGMDTNEVIARFQAERQALALMDHPNIAKVFDGGATDNGRPYFVMELVRGIPITEFCDQACLSMSARLKLFVDVCQAIQHAHRRGVIHRDIKPSNVLVSLHDDVPVVKVIDFGVAKAINQRLTELSIYTQFQQIIGTPLYMSPEQAELSGLDIDTRTDVYSLGVLLYELLTGVTPFDRQQFAKAAYDEMRRIIREEEPKRPSTRISTLSQQERSRVASQRGVSPTRLSQQLKGELDWILTKAMEKNRTRRYESAGAFAEDIERYLGNEPVEAVAPSIAYRFRKFVARRKLIATTAAVVLVSLLLGVAGTTWQAIEARRHAAIAEEHEAAALHNLYNSEVLTAKRELDDLNTKRAFELINNYGTLRGGHDFRGFEWRWLWQQFNNEEFRLIGHTAEVRAVRFSPDGKLVASGTTDGTVRLWDLRTHQEIWRYKGGEHCNLVDFSSDGTRLLAAFYSPVLKGETGVVWDISNPSRPARIGATNKAIGRFSPHDNEQFFCWGSPAILDLQGNVLRDLSFGWPRHVTDNWSLAVHSNEIWNMQMDKRLATLPAHTGLVSPDWSSAAVSLSDPNLIVTGSVEGARVWDSAGNALGTLPSTAGRPITAIDFSEQGDLVLVYRATGGIQVFEVSTNAPDTWESVGVFPAFAGSCLDFSPVENDLFVAGGEEGFLRGYRGLHGESSDVKLDHTNTVVAMRFSPNCAYLAVGMKEGECHLWDIHNRHKLFEASQDEQWKLRSNDFFCRDTIEFSPDSRLVAFVGPQDVLTMRNILSGESKQFGRSQLGKMEEQGAIKYSCPEFSADGTRLYATLTIGNTAFVEAWDLSGETPHLLDALTRRIGPRFANSLNISVDGSLLTAETVGQGAQIYTLPKLEPIQQLDIDAESGALALRFSPDGRYLATSGFVPNVAIIWDTSTWRRTVTLHHAFPVTHVSWSPDGKRLATSDFSAITRLWDVATGQLVSMFRGAASEFSPDGNTLAVGAMGSDYVLEKENLGRVVLHRAPSIAEIDALESLSTQQQGEQ